MKKLLLTLLTLMAGFNLLAMVPVVHYKPAKGPLTLHDSVDGRGNVTARGNIMQIILANDPAIAGSDPKLASANAALAAFDGQGQHFKSYQAIMTSLRQATNTAQATAAIQAIETVIMHMYDYNVYMLGHYGAGRSIVITGIRWSLFNPFSYIWPMNWLSDNDPELKQLIDELEQLAEIATRKHALIGGRIQATVLSYRHWRQVLALGFIAYLTANASSKGWDDSIMNTFCTDGLSGFKKMAHDMKDDVKQGTKIGFDATKTAMSTSWKYGIKPFAHAILYGFKNSDTTTTTDKKTTTPQQLAHARTYPQSAWYDYLKKFQQNKPEAK